MCDSPRRTSLIRYISYGYSRIIFRILDGSGSFPLNLVLLRPCYIYFMFCVYVSNCIGTIRRLRTTAALLVIIFLHAHQIGLKSLTLARREPIAARGATPRIVRSVQAIAILESKEVGCLDDYAPARLVRRDHSDHSHCCGASAVRFRRQCCVGTPAPRHASTRCGTATTKKAGRRQGRK